MGVIAVPVKALERSKSRLSQLLSPIERAALSLAMLQDVLDACRLQPGWDVWVVSTDEAALEVAGAAGIRPVAETGRSLLEAVRQVERSMRARSGPLAIVLADLPFATAESIARALSVRASVVAAAAASDGGTNILVRWPPAVISARFGRASFTKHRWAARRAGVSFEEIQDPDLAFDLDTPDDLADAVRRRRPGRTGTVCVELGLEERLRVATEA